MALHHLQPEVPGDIADDSDVDYSVNPPIVRRLHLEVLDWSGDDIVTVFPIYMVSPELGSALQEAGMTGFELDDADVTRDPDSEFDFEDGIYDFRWLKITGTPGEHNLGHDKRARLLVDEGVLEVVQRFQLDTGFVEDWPRET